MELYINDEKKFTVTYKERIVPALKVKFFTILSGLQEDKIQAEIIESASNAKLEDGEVTPSAMTLGELLKFGELQKRPPDIETIKHNDLVYLELLQTIIDKKKLTEEQSNLVKSDIEGEFWQNQDMNEVIKEVTNFRQTIAT